MKLYTIGYGGRTIEEFVKVLEAMGVDLLIDVRRVPRSRKPGFSWGALDAGFTGHFYRWFGDLGTPTTLRSRYKAGLELTDFLHQYDGYIRTESVEKTIKGLLGDILKGGLARPCLMCLEADAKKCHRSVLAARMMELSGPAGHPGIEGIVDL